MEKIATKTAKKTRKKRIMKILETAEGKREMKQMSRRPIEAVARGMLIEEETKEPEQDEKAREPKKLKRTKKVKKAKKTRKMKKLKKPKKTQETKKEFGAPEHPAHEAMRTKVIVLITLV